MKGRNPEASRKLPPQKIFHDRALQYSLKLTELGASFSGEPVTKYSRKNKMADASSAAEPQVAGAWE